MIYLLNLLKRVLY